jgi:type 1 fimbria pilin
MEVNMKKIIYPILFVFNLSFLLGLQSCSFESTITQPTEKSVNNLELRKTNVLKISNTNDTIIVLPKSNISIIISKDISSDKIKILDKYLFEHKNISELQIVTPNALSCDIYIERYMVLQNQYRSVVGKFLGIWTDLITMSKCYNTYGFNNIFVGTSNIPSAHSAGFKFDSIMVPIDSYSTAFGTISTANSYGIRYYHINEPFERGSFSGSDLVSVGIMISNANTNSKMMMCSYKMPDYCFFQPDNTFGARYSTVLYSTSNSYMMCDEYHGNCCGSVDDFWTRFRNYYGSNRCISNWVHLVINNGNGSVTCGTGNANSWYDLLGDANENGVNKIWLYALSTGNEDAINNFCSSAWRRSWLSRLARELVVIWKCDTPNPCIGCNWANNKGPWHIQQSYYDGIYQWLSY